MEEVLVGDLLNAQMRCHSQECRQIHILYVHQTTHAEHPTRLTYPRAFRQSDTAIGQKFRLRRRNIAFRRLHLTANRLLQYCRLPVVASSHSTRHHRIGFIDGNGLIDVGINPFAICLPELGILSIALEFGIDCLSSTMKQNIILE